MSTACLPIANDKHTEILGYRGGKRNCLWRKLDWKNWRIDGPGKHLFNAGGHYLHVNVRGDEGMVYRVRCFYAGRTYRGKKVTGIGIMMKNGKLHWIVRTDKTKGAK